MCFQPGGEGGKGSFAKKLAITGLVGVGAAAVGVIAAPVIATAALGAGGLTASGVAAGSTAAAIQSSLFGGSGLIGGITGLAGAGTTWGFSKFFVRFCHLFDTVSNDVNL